MAFWLPFKHISLVCVSDQIARLTNKSLTPNGSDDVGLRSYLHHVGHSHALPPQQQIALSIASMCHHSLPPLSFKYLAKFPGSPTVTTNSTHPFVIIPPPQLFDQNDGVLCFPHLCGFRGRLERHHPIQAGDNRG